jgi:hypothetical protein
VFLHPGVSDSYKIGWSHTLGTVWGMPGGAAQTRQFFDRYPDYAVLASASDSIGDLQFDIVIPGGMPAPVQWIDIYVPPEFRWNPDLTIAESIWTDMTNDYQYIWGDFRNPRPIYDPIAPGWTQVRIGLRLGPDWAPSGGTMTIAPGTYHIRLFNLRAPTVAGLYHFKFYVNGVSIGAANFPIIVVKSELNPAYIAVTVRTHAFPAPPYVSGRVLANGTTPDGRAVSGVGYWGPNDFLGNNPTPGAAGAEYRVLLMGLAAGTYTLTAEGSGFNPTTTARLTLDPGQSYSAHIVIYDSSDVHVTIWSKHGAGATPWHNLWQMPYGTNDPVAAPNNAGPRRDMLLELYGASNNLIGFWASNAIAAAPKRIPAGNTLVGLHDDGACVPTATQYNAWLRDNWDLLGNVRGYPSTHWDGHVPYDTADYVAGIPNGQYTVEAFVTGYIMDAADDYLRTFTVSGITLNLQFDLRRSNWIETVMHLPATPWPLSAPTTVTLTATDAAGKERAASAFTATPAMTADGDLDGADVSAGAYTGGIVIEGWNAIFPNVGDRRPAGDINKKDYGLNPRASSHSAGAVTPAGNPYTLHLYMADMGVPTTGAVGTGWYNVVGGDQAVSVFLCNSAASLSFAIVNARLWISLRSADFEVPAHSRPWTFPGSEIWVDFTDVATGEIQDSLDPTVYGLIQDAGMYGPPVLPFPAGVIGFAIAGAPTGSYGVSPWDNDNVHLPGQHEHVGVTYCGNDMVAAYGLPIYRALFDSRSTRLPAGEYIPDVHTHGYIMRRSFAVNLPFSGMADIEADLIQGGQIRVMMEFRHEGVATGFNGFVRVEVFNANDELVGASIYGQADPNWYTVGTSGGGYLPYVAWSDWKVVLGPAQAADFGQPGQVPLPTSFPSSATGVSNGQRAITSSYLYNVPGPHPGTWASWDDMIPSDANRVQVPAGQVLNFDIFGFYWYCGNGARTWAGGWPTTDGINHQQLDSGLRGSADIPGWEGSGGGLYTVKVWAFDPRGPDNAYESVGATDDWRMYSMGWELNDISLSWGGAQELSITMNDMASLRGTVRWFDTYGNLRPLPWAQINASPGPSADNIPAYSTGNGAIGAGASDPSGAYIMWLPAGTHHVSISTSEAPQIWSSSAPSRNTEYIVVASDGWVGGGDSQLSASGTPVPELQSAVLPLGLFAVLAASAWLLRKTANVPILMK